MKCPKCLSENLKMGDLYYITCKDCGFQNSKNKFKKQSNQALADLIEKELAKKSGHFLF